MLLTIDLSQWPSKHLLRSFPTPTWASTTLASCWAEFFQKENKTQLSLGTHTKVGTPKSPVISRVTYITPLISGWNSSSYPLEIYFRPFLRGQICHSIYKLDAGTHDSHETRNPTVLVLNIVKVCTLSQGVKLLYWQTKQYTPLKFTRWWFQICFFLNFQPYLEKIPILPSICFKWVGSTTN